MKINPSSKTDRHLSLRRQRGAVAVWFGAFLLALLAALALAIDIGRLYTSQRTLQKQANLAALDAARLVSRCSMSGLPSAGDLTAAVQASLAQNGVSDPDGTFQAWDVEHGVVDVDGATNFRRFTPSVIDDAEAVRVTLRQSLPSPIMPFLRSNPEQIMSASATATQSALGSLRVGSTLLSLDGGVVNGLLSALLGGNINIGVVGYQGLAGVDLTVDQLALALGLTAKDLSDPLVLQTATPILSDVINNLATDLSGLVSTEASNALQELAGETTNNSPIPLGDILGPVGEIAGSVPVVNLGELINAMAMATHADPSGTATPLELPLGVSLPGVTTLNTFIRILEPPQLSGLGRPGETEAHTSQIDLMVRLQLDTLGDIDDSLTLLLGGGLLGSVDADPESLNLGIDVSIANASAYLDRIQCPRAGSPQVEADTSANATVADIKLGTFIGSAADAPDIEDGTQLLQGVTINLVGGLLASVKVNLFLDDSVQVTAGDSSRQNLQTVDEFTQVGSDGATRYWQADEAPDASNNPQTVGSTGILSSTMSSLSGSLLNNISASDPDHPNESTSICLLILLCIPVGDILDAVLDPVLALVGAVLSSVGGVVDLLLDPLLSALGVQVGSATVTMETVAIDQPHLVTIEVPPQTQ